MNTLPACLLLALTSLLGCLPLSSLADPAEKRWGFYQIHWRTDQFRQGIAEQIQALGAKPDYILFFNDLHPRRGFPSEAAQTCQEFGAIPVISQELALWGKRSQSLLEEINGGQFDGFWRDWARAALAHGGQVLLRFGFEMNGDWFSWGQQPEAFVAAWKRVHGIVRGEFGAENVRFLFSPNVVWTDQPLVQLEPYYPGDDFVDLLGLDGYNFGDHFDRWHRWQSYQEIFETSIETISQWNKPLLLAEIGCAHGPRKAQWLESFLEAFAQDERLAGFIYYNHGDGKNGEPNWRLDSDPDSLAVVRHYLQGLPK
ncbi:MAG: glycosyl hydrolase [Verrucomicrobiota bacterium]